MRRVGSARPAPPRNPRYTEGRVEVIELAIFSHRLLSGGVAVLASHSVSVIFIDVPGHLFLEKSTRRRGAIQWQRQELEEVKRPQRGRQRSVKKTTLQCDVASRLKVLRSRIYGMFTEILAAPGEFSSRPQLCHCSIVRIMANAKHLRMLKKGVAPWNTWRSSPLSPEHLDLSGADLHEVNLIGANLIGTDLREAYARGAYLRDADLSRATLYKADLSGADLNEANLCETDLSEAYLRGATLHKAHLNKAILRGANLRKAISARRTSAGRISAGRTSAAANLIGAELSRADFTRANLIGANLRGANLRAADFSGITARLSLEMSTSARPKDYTRPSKSDLRRLELTLFIARRENSRGVPPRRRCARQFHHFHEIVDCAALEFYSCFISYSSVDNGLVERLYVDLQAKGVRCWFAPEDLKIGDKFRTRIDESIRIHDKLLLVLSQNSIRSSWVEKEVETAFERERRENRIVLFPIRLDRGHGDG